MLGSFDRCKYINVWMNVRMNIRKCQECYEVLIGVNIWMYVLLSLCMIVEIVYVLLVLKK